MQPYDDPFLSFLHSVDDLDVPIIAASKRTKFLHEESDQLASSCKLAVSPCQLVAHLVVASTAQDTFVPIRLTSNTTPPTDWVLYTNQVAQTL